MSDIGNRIRRYRLSRYAAPRDPVRRRLRWFWLLALLWLAWAGLLSNHSAYRLWRLGAEQHRTQLEIEKARMDFAAVERERAERMLRANGMARPGEVVYRVRDGAPDTLAP